MNKFIGIDNGVTGTIGIIYGERKIFEQVPTKKEQNYTKAKQNITRVNVVELKALLEEYIMNDDQAFALIERPMVNPQRWKATQSAIRCLEAWLTILEDMRIGFDYCDSKEWQKELLPKGVKGTEELKKASKDIGCRLFPEHQELMIKQGDADGILIAEYCRRKFN